jgi:diaminopimelate decarboxylase
MNDLVRPSLYDSFHEIWPLTTNGSGDARRRYDIVGPICESGDYLAKNRVLKPLKQGDLIAFASAGAYGFTMSSNYNARPRVPEVMVRGKRFAVIRDRESRKDLIRGERIPKWV